MPKYHTMLTFSQFLEHYSQILNEENFVLVTDQGIEEDTVKNFIREFVETPQITLKNNGLELTGKAKRKVYKV